METPIFTYWEGPRHAMADLCLESLTRHNPTARVIGPEELEALGGGDVYKDTLSLPITFRSDLIRIWLLMKFGGVWVDADCIHVAPMDDFAKEVPNWDLIGVWNPHQNQGFGASGLLACPFGMREGSPVGPILFRKCSNLLGSMKKGNRVPYAQTSTGLLSQVFLERRGFYKMARWEHWRLNPVPWNKARKVYLPKMNLPPYLTPEEAATGCRMDEDAQYPKFGPMFYEYKSFWNPRAICYHLTNVGFNPFRDKTREEVLFGKSFVSFLFQKAFGLPPGVFPRAWSICQRIREIFPKETPVVGAEIGVFQGDCSRQILQQCPNVRLLLVDKWDNNHPASYKTTGDGCVTIPKNWQNVLKICKTKLSPFGDRAEYRQGNSRDEAAKVADGSLDFVFIDGDHSFQGTTADLVDWVRKVKPGGFVAGHDLDHPLDKAGKFGVRRALEAFFGPLGIPWESGLDTTWFVRVPFSGPIILEDRGQDNGSKKEDETKREEASESSGSEAGSSEA